MNGRLFLTRAFISSLMNSQSDSAEAAVGEFHHEHPAPSFSQLVHLPRCRHSDTEVKSIGALLTAIIIGPGTEVVSA